MLGSLDLMNKALEKQSASDWARKFGITSATFTNAKARGHLSPALAGNLAIELGEDAAEWMAIAAIESEKDSPLVRRLKKSQAGWRRGCP